MAYMMHGEPKETTARRLLCCQPALQRRGAARADQAPRGAPAGAPRCMPRCTPRVHAAARAAPACAAHRRWRRAPRCRNDWPACTELPRNQGTRCHADAGAPRPTRTPFLALLLRLCFGALVRRSAACRAHDAFSSGVPSATRSARLRRALCAALAKARRAWTAARQARAQRAPRASPLPPALTARTTAQGCCRPPPRRCTSFLRWLHFRPPRPAPTQERRWCAARPCARFLCVRLLCGAGQPRR
jgi:hypothetical protein